MKALLKFLHFLFLLFCLIVQLSFIEQLKIFHVNIDLVLIAVLGIAIFDGSILGLIYGFIAGLTLDFMVGGIIGINALIYSMSGFAAGKMMELGFRNFKKRILTNILIVFFFTEINLLFTSSLYYLFNFGSSSVILGTEMIINPVCNIIVMFLIFPLLRAGLERSEEIGFTFKGKI